MKKVSLEQRVLGYVLVVAQVLLLLGLFSLAKNGDTTGAMRIFSVAIMAAGIFITVYSGMVMGKSLWPTPIPKASGHLVSEGPFKFVRHPLYAGLILFGVGSVLRSAQFSSLYTLGALIIILVWKMSIEDRLLVDHYPDFEEYRNTTPALIPGRRSVRKSR